MQLNNKNTGQSVVINIVDPRDNLVKYTKYEFQVREDVILNEGTPEETIERQLIKEVVEESYKPVIFDKSKLDMPSLIMQSGAKDFLQLSYQYLKDNLFPDYVIEEDEQNWLHINKPFRVFINAISSMKEEAVNADYKALKEALFTLHKDFIEVEGEYIGMYVDSLKPEELAAAANVELYTEAKF